MRRILLCWLVLISAVASAQTTLYGFSGDSFLGGSFLAGDGNVYFITSQGLLSVSPSGTYKLLNSQLVNVTFCLETSDGTLLSMVSSGETTNFVKIALTGKTTTLAPVPTGAGCPIVADDGNFYGTATSGGAYNFGQIFRLTPVGNITTVYSFTGYANSDGGQPTAMIQASDGTFYGLNILKQQSESGLFHYSPAAGMTVYSLGEGGSSPPSAPLIQAVDGNFYFFGGGVVQVTPTGTLTVLAYTPDPVGFPSAGGTYQGVLGGDGRFYLADSIPTTAGCAPGSFAAMFPVESDGTVDAEYLQWGDTYSDGPAGANFIQGGNGIFYGTGSITTNTYDNETDCDLISSTTANSVFEFNSYITPMTPPIEMTLTADHILPGKTATLTWRVNNAYSDTMQQCYGYGGLSGKLALSGSLTSPALAAGTYAPGIVCGGVEANTATLTVGNTQLALTSNVTEIVAGQSVTLTATVANDANPSPTGTVQFLYGTVVLGTAKMNSTGVATFTASTTGVPAGTYGITAKYLGDGNYAAATSAAVSIQVVPKGTTTTTLTPTMQTVIIGQNVPNTATITTNSVIQNPTGTVSLLVGATVVATVEVLYGNPSTATFSSSSAGLAAGTYTVTAKYSGDTYNLASTSAPVTVKLIKQDTLAVTASSNPVPADTAFQLGATATGAVTPTGTVLFYAGSLALGSATLNGSGVASITVSSGTLGAGTYQITAYYAGDANNAAITSPAITLTVQ